MNIFKLCAMAALFAFVPVSGSNQAHAEDGLATLPRTGTFTVEPYAGTAVAVGGTFLKGASEQLTSNTLAGGVVFSSLLSFDVSQRNFSDVYYTANQFGLDVSYGLSESSEVFAGVSYMHASAQEFDLMNITFTGSIGGNPNLSAGTIVTGQFSDYQEYGAQIGYRRFFNMGSALKPFAGTSLGIRKINPIDLKLWDSSGPTSLDRLRFYNSTIAYSVGLEFGVRYDIDETIALGVTSGINYRTDLRSDDADIFGFNDFHQGNNKGDILSIPVSVRLTARF